MAGKRLEKVSKIIRSTISDVIQNDLSDPRVRGMVSVTRVELAADLRSGRVYLSILGLDETGSQLCFKGIEHAKGYIQSRLASNLTMKSCPVLSFYLDDSLKKGFKMLQLLDEVAAENAESDEKAALNGDADGMIPEEFDDAE